MTKLLQRPLDRNYGDIDVLAWRATGRRLLLIECKDVQFRKSNGEVAEQLADFLGEIKEDGKPDTLRKHLDRVAVAKAHAAALDRYVPQAKVEAHLVFKNKVPMAFAWDRLKGQIALRVFDDLDKL